MAGLKATIIVSERSAAEVVEATRKLQWISPTVDVSDSNYAHLTVSLEAFEAATNAARLKPGAPPAAPNTPPPRKRQRPPPPMSTAMAPTSPNI